MPVQLSVAEGIVKEEQGAVAQMAAPLLLEFVIVLSFFLPVNSGIAQVVSINVKRSFSNPHIRLPKPCE